MTRRVFAILLNFPFKQNFSINSESKFHILPSRFFVLKVTQITLNISMGFYGLFSRLLDKPFTCKYIRFYITNKPLLNIQFILP